MSIPFMRRSATIQDAPASPSVAASAAVLPLAMVVERGVGGSIGILRDQ
jgi:hypothetical protein